MIKNKLVPFSKSENALLILSSLWPFLRNITSFEPGWPSVTLNSKHRTRI